MTDEREPAAGAGSGSGSQEEVGSLADEATRLFGALGDWARDHDPAPGSTAAPGSAGTATGGPDCTWCPVCRTVHAVRQTSPEVRDQLLTAATSLMQAGAGLLAALQVAATERPASPGRPAAGPGVQHIDLDDAPDATPDGPRDHEGEA